MRCGVAYIKRERETETGGGILREGVCICIFIIDPRCHVIYDMNNLYL